MNCLPLPMTLEKRVPQTHDRLQHAPLVHPRIDIDVHMVKGDICSGRMRPVSSGESDLGRKLVAAAMNLAVDGTAMEVVRAFQSADVPCIVLKGPALAEWLYGPARDRYSVDVDLLVGSASLSSAEKVLRRLGYAPLVADLDPSDRPRYARVWHRDHDRANVDLHTTLAGIGLPSNEAWTVFSGETEPRAVGAVRAEIFAPGARALHVALHAAGHGPENPKSLEDIRRAVQLLPIEVWREAAALAMRLDAVPAFATGLALAPKGRELAHDLGVAGQSTVETALRAQRTTPLALGVEWLSRLPGTRAKIRFVASKIAPPPSFMRRWHPLARGGPLGLAAAYAYRPIWLLLKLGPAFVAWRRAKKTSTRIG